MKLIIDIPEEVVTAIQNGEDYRYDIHTTIAQGIPYEPKGDLISREAIKKIVVGTLEKWADGYCYIEIPTDDAIKEMKSAIDNVLTVLHDNYSMGYQDGVRKALSERPKGRWVKIFDNPFTNGYVCPFCGHKIQVTEQFLPKVTECEACGAELEGDVE